MDIKASDQTLTTSNTCADSKYIYTTWNISRNHWCHHQWSHQKLSDTNDIAMKYPTQMASSKRTKRNHYGAVWAKKLHLTHFVYSKNISKYFRKSVYNKIMNYFRTVISKLYDCINTNSSDPRYHRSPLEIICRAAIFYCNKIKK